MFICFCLFLPISFFLYHSISFWALCRHFLYSHNQSTFHVLLPVISCAYYLPYYILPLFVLLQHLTSIRHCIVTSFDSTFSFFSYFSCLLPWHFSVAGSLTLYGIVYFGLGFSSGVVFLLVVKSPFIKATLCAWVPNFVWGILLRSRFPLWGCFSFQPSSRPCLRQTSVPGSLILYRVVYLGLRFSPLGLFFLLVLKSPFNTAILCAWIPYFVWDNLLRSQLPIGDY